MYVGFNFPNFWYDIWGFYVWYCLPCSNLSNNNISELDSHTYFKNLERIEMM